MMALEDAIYSEVIRGYTFDIFGLATFVELISIFTDWAWLILLTIPIAITVWGVRALLNWVFTPTEEELAETEEMNSHRTKKEKKLRNRRR